MFNVLCSYTCHELVQGWLYSALAIALAHVRRRSRDSAGFERITGFNANGQRGMRRSNAEGQCGRTNADGRMRTVECERSNAEVECGQSTRRVECMRRVECGACGHSKSDADSRIRRSYFWHELSSIEEYN